jgi:hypothetical protein
LDLAHRFVVILFSSGGIDSLGLTKDPAVRLVVILPIPVAVWAAARFMA